MAKMAFQAFYPTFSTKTMKGIVLTGAARRNPGATVLAECLPYCPARPDLCRCRLYGRRGGAGRGGHRNHRPRGQSLRTCHPVFRWFRVHDRDDGVGFGPIPRRRVHEGVRASVPFYVAPTNLVSEAQSFSLDGSVPIQLLPASDGGAGLMVWLPDHKILIAGDSGRYLPDAGSIRQAGVSIPERIKVLDQMLDLAPTIFVPAHGLPITDQASVLSALTAQRDALQSIYDQALARINAGDTIDEAAAAVALPADLAASPYNQELVSTIPGIVRNLYHEKLGWFGGETHELASTLTPAAKAAALADALGGSDALTAAARTAELNARDLAGAEKALYLAEAAYEAAPEDAAARQVYAQALRKNAFMQKSAQVRNYYLYVAFHTGAKRHRFRGIGGREHRPRLQRGRVQRALHRHLRRDPGHGPDPDLASGGTRRADVQVAWPCHAGEAIPVSEWVGLVFIPTSDWNGETSFTWNGSSGGNNAAQPATVTITIAPLNDAPVVSSPMPDMTADEDALSATVDLSTAFTDAEGDPLSYTVQSSNPALVDATLNGATLTLDFQAEQNGAATITVSAADEAGEYGGVWATDDFVVTVNPVNDAPWATGQTESVTAGRARTFTLAYGDVETAKADLVVTFSGPSVGALDTSALPSVTYTAPAGYIGPDSFTYTVTDRGDPDGCSAAPCSGALQAQATVSLDVAENSIKGRVYNDANANGSPDEGEAGVAGVTVRLTPLDGSPAVELVTGEDGAYAFGSLLPGAYQVRQDLLPGYVQTTPDPADIDLALGQALGGVDFGVVYSADLSVTMTADVNDRTIIYTFVVTNNGPAEALDAVLNNVRPHGVSYTSIITTRARARAGTR